MDLVVRAPRFPASGETLMGSSFSTFPGGKGANQAVAAAKLGGEVYFVGCVGEDGFGDSLRQSLADAGVQLGSLVSRPETSTGIAAITVDDLGQNTIVVAPGANSRVTALQGIAALEAHHDSVLLIQLEIPLEIACEILSSGKAGMTVLNPAPADVLPSALYPHIDVITPNESEAHLLTGVSVIDIDSAARAAEVLLDRGVKHVIVTLGEQGAYYATANEERHYPAYPVQAVDTVGAGDAFSGALALFLSQGREIDHSIRLAVIAAALSTTKAGAQGSMPDLAALKAVVPTDLRI